MVKKTTVSRRGRTKLKDDVVVLPKVEEQENEQEQEQEQVDENELGAEADELNTSTLPPSHFKAKPKTKAQKELEKQQEQKQKLEKDQDSDSQVDSNSQNKEKLTTISPTTNSTTNVEENGRSKLDKKKLIVDRKSKNLFEKARKKVQMNEEEGKVGDLPLVPLKYRPEIQSPEGVGIPLGSSSQIKKMVLGNSIIDCWYSAPYPEEYACNEILFNCEFCLKYMKHPYTAHRHKIKCTVRRPPGDEIYRKENLSIFEVDGHKNKIYCQNLCLIAKMFLDHKTLYYDVEPFLFYVLVEVDEEGCHLAGYFSKEKRSGRQYNLSCILVLPNHMRKGYGYLLTRKENKLGSPEKPLSKLGLVSYRAYWKFALVRLLTTDPSAKLSLEAICKALGMTKEDVLDTLNQNQLLYQTPNPASNSNSNPRLGIKLNRQLVDEFQHKSQLGKLIWADLHHLKWSPFLIRDIDFPIPSPPSLSSPPPPN